jgi:hypothetical protein
MKQSLAGKLTVPYQSEESIYKLQGGREGEESGGREQNSSEATLV